MLELTRFEYQYLKTRRFNNDINMNYLNNDRIDSTLNEHIRRVYNTIVNTVFVMLLSSIITFEINASSVPPTERADKDTTAVFSWSIPPLSKFMGKNTPIDEMLATIKSEPDIGINSVLLVHKGKLIVEEYFGGWNADSIHTTRSASKAITSALVGIAIDKEYLSGVEEKKY